MKSNLSALHEYDVPVVSNGEPSVVLEISTGVAGAFSTCLIRTND